jgi:hypothetical protein
MSHLTTCVVTMVAVAVVMHSLIGKCATSVAQETSAAESSPGLKDERNRLWDIALKRAAEGKLVEAAAAGEEMLAIERKWLGDDDREVLYSIEWLASIYERSDNWPNAEMHRRAALLSRELDRGAVHWKTIDARLALETTQLMGRLNLAEREQVSRAVSTNAEGVRLYNEGRYAEAEALYQEAASVRKKFLGDDHPDYAQCLSNLAQLYHAAKDRARARPFYEAALSIRKARFGVNHPVYAESLNGLAAHCLDTGEDSRAEELLNESIGIYRNTEESGRPDYVVPLHNLAVIYRNRGEYGRAESLYIEGLAMRKAALGETHPDYAASLNQLGVFYYDTAESARAEPLLRESLAIYRKVHGPEHPHTLLSLKNLGSLYS